MIYLTIVHVSEAFARPQFYLTFRINFDLFFILLEHHIVPDEQLVVMHLLEELLSNLVLKVIIIHSREVELLVSLLHFVVNLEWIWWKVPIFVPLIIDSRLQKALCSLL